MRVETALDGHDVVKKSGALKLRLLAAAVGLVIVLPILSPLKAGATVTDTWTGGGGNDNWSTALNWSAGIPTTGEALVFPSSTTSVDDMAGLSVASLTMAGGAISGSVTLATGSIEDTDADPNVSDTISITTIQLPNAGTPSITSDHANLTISSGITGTPTSVSLTGPPVNPSDPSYLLFTGAMSYTGATTTQGLIDIDGSHTTGTITTSSGGEFDGNGTIGNLVVQSGATLSPGGFTTPVLTASAVTLNSGSSFETFILNASTYTVLDASGAVQLNGAVPEMALGYRPLTGQTFTLISNSSGSPVTGTFDDGSGGSIANGSDFVVDGEVFSVNYDSGPNHDVVITALDPDASPHSWDSGLFATNTVNSVHAWGQRQTAGFWGTGPVNYISGATLTDRASSSGTLTFSMNGTYCPAGQCAYGGGSGYKGFVQLWNDPSNYIAFGLIHDPAVSPSGTTIMIEGAGNGRPVGGYWPAGAITGANHTVRVVWGPGGITFTLDNAVTLGPYPVGASDPSISFLAAGRGTGDISDTTFSNITFS